MGHTWTAKDRFERYRDELERLLMRARSESDMGRWQQTSNELFAAITVLGRMAASCLELELLNRLIEEDTDARPQRHRARA